MLLLLINPALVLPVLLLSLPFYYLSKLLEKKIQPRKSGWQFLAWLVSVLAVAGVYLLLAGFVYIWFTRP